MRSTSRTVKYAKRVHGIELSVWLLSYQVAITARDIFIG